MTGTSNPFSFPGRLVITGGAVSPDGRRVALRTYADAFEFDVPADDLVRAVTDGSPRVIPLPDEPQGESVAYSSDGRALLTVSEVADQPAGTGAELLRYPLPDRPAGSAPSSSSPAATSAAAPSSRSPAASPAAARRGRGFPTAMLVAGMALFVAAATLGLVVVRRSRRARR